MILDNLARPASRTADGTSGSTFAAVEPYAGDYIQAVGETRGRRRRRRKRIGIAIGPQYGTVGPAFIKDAAREAIKAERRSTCCACSPSPSTRRRSAPTEDYVSSDDGFADVAAERNARPAAGAAGADEQRPGDGRRPQEDRRRQPVHRLRRARHRHRGSSGDERGRRDPRRRRVRPDHRRGPQPRHRPDRAVDDRHQLQRGVVLRPPLLLHRRQRPLQAAEDER